MLVPTETGASLAGISGWKEKIRPPCGAPIRTDGDVLQRRCSIVSEALAHDRVHDHYPHHHSGWRHGRDGVSPSEERQAPNSEAEAAVKHRALLRDT